MDKIIVEGQRTLTGTVNISGAKNAVLPIMAATLLWPAKYRLNNVPNLRDTRTMAQLMEIIGATVSFENNVMDIDTTDCNNPIAPYDLVKTMRASFYVLGPLLARFGRCKVSLPGGCNWGPRPVDLHLMSIEKLGAKIDLTGGYINATGTLKGAIIDFNVSSVGATGNAVMAAALAEGKTILNNAAEEPEIVALCDFLVKMGADITGIGTTSIHITGVKLLQGVEATIIPDRVEAGTFLLAGAMIGDRLRIAGVEPDHLVAVLAKLASAGVTVENIDGDLIVSKPADIISTDAITAPYPGYPTDLQAQWIAFMSQAEGTSVIQDTIYLDRFSHVPELTRLGAQIKLEHNIATVIGKSDLIGAPVMSTDIRASASLILATLVAEGTSEISRVYHIDRGYEDLEAKFNGIGARMERVSE